MRTMTIDVEFLGVCRAVRSPAAKLHGAVSTAFMRVGLRQPIPLQGLPTRFLKKMDQLELALDLILGTRKTNCGRLHLWSP